MKVGISVFSEIFSKATFFYLWENKPHSNTWLSICVTQLFCLETEVDTDVRYITAICKLDLQ